MRRASMAAARGSAGTKASSGHDRGVSAGGGRETATTPSGRRPSPSGCACGGTCPRCAANPVEPLASFPHRGAIASAFGIPNFDAPATIDPSLSGTGAEAVTEHGGVRFARQPVVEVAAHEAAHVLQMRGTGRRTDRGGAERHAASVAARVIRGFGASDLIGRGLVSAGPGPLFFVPAGSARMTHTVVAGETLAAIAVQVYGDARYVGAIARANPRDVTVNAAGEHVIVPGAVLLLPDQPDAADPWVNPEIRPLLVNGGTWTQPQAEATLRAFMTVTRARRDEMVARYAGFNHLGDMLLALPANSTQAGGTFVTQARDLLERIQRVGARADAASQGLASEAEMAQAQADEMIARNTAAAAAALPAGSAPPTPAEIAAQQAAQVASGSIAPQTATMTRAEERTLNNTLNTVSIPAFVTWVAANHPELGLTARHLRAEARGIFERGAGIVAMTDPPHLRAAVGDAFMQMVAANPAYALPTVVHEVWGHNTYEGMGTTYGLDLYDASARRMPGYVRPRAGSDARVSEEDNYGYHETEMYSLMREVPYYVANAPADSALDSMNYDPAPEIQNRMQLIKDAFEARVARALVRGLYLRFQADPTINGAAFAAFTTAVVNVFPPADAAAILA